MPEREREREPEGIQVDIERVVAGGDGLAHHEGRVVFVPGTAEGERHRVEVTGERRDFLRARSLAVIRSSPQRREPPCPYYEACGGCSLMHLEPGEQLRVKRHILEEALLRAGLGERVEAVAIETAAGPEIGYRNRLRFHVAPPASGARARAPVVGFRRRASREIVDVDRCLLAPAGIARALTGVRALLRGRPLLAKFLAEVEIIESGEKGGRVIARFFVRSNDGLRFFDRAREAEIRDRCGLAGFVVSPSGKGRGPRVRVGDGEVPHDVAGLSVSHSAESFFQTNRFLLDALVAATVGDERLEGRRVLDLFCGVGFFSLPFARIAESVLGVESQASAVRDARANADGAGLGNVRFRRAESDRFMARAKLRPSDLVVADPPRGGLTKALVDALVASPIRAFRYVSCDPPALARDAARLEAGGFRLHRLVLIDLFPNTHLFETVAYFSR